MGKITLNEALKKASVKNDLQMFLGLDAQSELGGMTPERLAAVAGGLLCIGLDKIEGTYNHDTIECVQTIIDHYGLKKDDLYLKLFGIYQYNGKNLYRGFIYTANIGKIYGSIEIMGNDGQTSRFRIVNSIITKL